MLLLGLHLLPTQSNPVKCSDGVDLSFLLAAAGGFKGLNISMFTNNSLAYIFCRTHLWGNCKDDPLSLNLSCGGENIRSKFGVNALESFRCANATNPSDLTQFRVRPPDQDVDQLCKSLGYDQGNVERDTSRKEICSRSVYNASSAKWVIAPANGNEHPIIRIRCTSAVLSFQ